MKHISFIFVLIAFAVLPARSQEEQKQKKNEFKLDLFGFLGSTFHAEYERAIRSNSSLNLVLAPTAIDNTNKEMYGIYLQVNPKFYYQAKKTDNFGQYLYFSPFASYRYFDIKRMYSDYIYPTEALYPGSFVAVENNFIANSVSAGTLFGYKIVGGDFFILNLEVGGGIRYVFNKQGNCSYSEVNQGFNNWNLGYSGIFPKFNLTMGFKF